MLEVNSDRNVGLMVWRRPRVSSKAESALVFLNTVVNLVILVTQLIQTLPVASLQFYPEPS